MNYSLVFQHFLLNLFILLAFSLQSIKSEDEDNSCRTPDGQTGICVYLTECAELMFIRNKSPLQKSDLIYLQRSQCGAFSSTKPMVCCKPNDNKNQLNSMESEPVLTARMGEYLPARCGEEIEQRLHNGEITDISEHPWMALLQFYEPEYNEKHFLCGGVLISEKYVLTAAHCLTIKSMELYRVRLGEWNYATETDCLLDLCSDPPIDVAVAKTFVHDHYNPINYQNDVGLIRLNETVNFTAYIKPICLPTSDWLRGKNYTDVGLTVAGWGKTEQGYPSQVKLKIDVNGVSSEKCSENYHRKIESSQICAGGDGEFDACKGDSGGPIMVHDMNRTKPAWYVAGIVSFGPYPCNVRGLPGVYTRADYYINWIFSNME